MMTNLFRSAVTTLALASVSLGTLGCPPDKKEDNAPHTEGDGHEHKKGEVHKEGDHEHKEGDGHDHDKDKETSSPKSK